MGDDERLSASDAAAARRERRRKRILENSEQRLKLILGQATATDDLHDKQPVPRNEEKPPQKSSLLDGELQQRVAAILGEELKEEVGSIWKLISDSSDVVDSPLNSEPDLLEVGDDDTVVQLNSATKKEEQAQPSTSALTGDVFFILFGLVVRLLFSTSLGSILFHNVLLPFIILEASIAYLGIRGDLKTRAGNVGLGKWMSLHSGALTLAGVDPNIIQAYSRVLSIAVLFLTDFSLYFVTFTLTHSVLPVR